MSPRDTLTSGRFIPAPCWVELNGRTYRLLHGQVHVLYCRYDPRAGRDVISKRPASTKAARAVIDLVCRAYRR